ncbi:CYTH domain-containing protein [Elioraea sp.]|uniref:CYTH domain-containing protein n=1 Tax=Elioraea sp. TaxID=2185103 RepID=UPI003F6E72B7
MASDGIEREFKLMLKDATERSRIEALLPQKRRLLRQRNIFFDTDDGRLVAARLTFRLRQENDAWLLTAKGPPLAGRGALTAREEAERVVTPALAAHLAAGTADPIPAFGRAEPAQVALALARRISEAADGKPVRPTGGFRNERTHVEIALPCGTKATLALDRSLMPDGAEHHEVELEVASSAARSTAAWLSGLLARAGVPPRTARSKRSRYEASRRRGAA